MDSLFTNPGRTLLAGMPEGYDALMLARLAAGQGDLLFIARDDLRLASLAEALAFFSPGTEILEFPAWDTVPYDRISPNVEIVSRRLETLTRLAEGAGKGRLVLTTVAALLQRVPPMGTLKGTGFAASVGGKLDLEALIAYLERHGYGRSDQVMEPGEYAVRGGIVDLYPPGTGEPLRLDLFGDELEGIRSFDPMTQRSSGKHDSLVLAPMSEVSLDEASVARFRSGYREMFGTAGGDDPLYEAVSAGSKFPGMENWLPLFHEGLDTLFAYLPEASVVLDHRFEQARDARLETIAEYYQARREVVQSKLSDGAAVYHPVPPETLYLNIVELERLLGSRAVAELSPFAAPDLGGGAVEAGGTLGPDFSEARTRPDLNPFEALRDIKVGEARRLVVAAFSAGSRARLCAVMAEHGVRPVKAVESWQEVLDLPPDTLAAVVLPLERGFSAPNLVVIGEQDLLGDRLVRPSHRRKHGADKFIADISSLAEGDLVVHVEHGIGRYDGLVTITAGGAPHDCLRLIYDGGDKLMVPVENIDVLSRYGSEEASVQLDRLGGVAWQARKAKLKKRIRDMAEGLIRIAAARQIRAGEVLTPPEGLFDEFAARFPYGETEDQLNAIADVLNDMASGKPMDRLICGDVGFGKTEVALRAAFVAAMSGVQVAVVVPTTLLARQHAKTFRERFAGLPVRVAQLSRLVTAKNLTQTKKDLKDGAVEIVVGTHALLSKSVEFSNLGLLIVDEEQHFGVAHKERLKALREDVHVLTLTATPIPRTLQLALAGVRELSIIATPPVDRLAVRTFVLPFDPVVVREAIQRERYRGGQIFYVCPRVADIDDVVKKVKQLTPDVKVAIAHGQMPPSQLEDVMNAFADGVYHLLVCTNIIESGLDMPSVNTIIMHRADMFGLAQLYQLRGRVGRSKARGYAYLTLPPRRKTTKTAERRLHVMQTLDTLGAGFTLASHDLDIRGAGNLLGDEQSGHIKEVGIELYQHLLEEAVIAAREGAGDAEEAKDSWSPQITIGTPVLIPEAYVADLGLRLGLYRRIASLVERREIEELAAELVDRFGPVPPEVENLLEVVALKGLCRKANVEKIDAGPKGAVIGLKDNTFPNPEGLVGYISMNLATVKVRPDHKIVIMRAWNKPADRLDGVRRIMESLAGLVGEGG